MNRNEKDIRNERHDLLNEKKWREWVLELLGKTKQSINNIRPYDHVDSIVIDLFDEHDRGGNRKGEKRKEQGS